MDESYSRQPDPEIESSHPGQNLIREGFARANLAQEPPYELPNLAKVVDSFRGINQIGRGLVIDGLERIANSSSQKTLPKKTGTAILGTLEIAGGSAISAIMPPGWVVYARDRRAEHREQLQSEP